MIYSFFHFCTQSHTDININGIGLPSSPSLFHLIDLLVLISFFSPKSDIQIDFWDSVYGFSMKVIKDIALSEPLVDVVESKAVITNAAPILTLDIMTCKKEVSISISKSISKSISISISISISKLI